MTLSLIYGPLSYVSLFIPDFMVFLPTKFKFYVKYDRKNAVWYDDVEIQVRNATSNAEGGVTAKQLLELRETALNPQKYVYFIHYV